MSNDEVYAAGLLIRALDPATQPSAIRAFMQEEIDLLDDIVSQGMTMIDIGCGTGRHLARLRDRVRIGFGVDYEHAYIVDAHRRAGGAPLYFVTGDATALPIRAHFDFAACMTNTWGTMSDKLGVLNEMRRCVPHRGMRLLSVFSEQSVPARREWYERFGHIVVDESSEWLLTEGGLRSEHFSEARLRSIVGECTIRPLADVAYIVRF